MEIIIALDPGIGRTGYAILRKDADLLTPVEYGCIETKPKSKTENRLKTIYNFLFKLIKKHKPTAMIVERIFFNTNQATAIVVGQAQGVMLLAAAQHQLEVCFVTPLQVKQALTGYGQATKDQVLKMVGIILKLKQLPKLDDTADALACGLTYFFTNKLLK